METNQADRQSGHQYYPNFLLLVEQLRHAVLDYLIEDEAITEDFANKLLAWEHPGFSVDNKVRVGANDLEGRRQLARYMIRNPFSL
ncbi:MAG: hypothetical protein GY938_00490 [Ketobacter sp.]|nr:hypothetical protein [Ketobacter sp.]